MSSSQSYICILENKLNDHKILFPISCHQIEKNITIKIKCEEPPIHFRVSLILWDLYFKKFHYQI